MKRRILKTLEAYLITNRDVLEETKIKDIEEQIKAVKDSLYTKKIYPIYQKHHDITFVMVDIIDEENDQPISLECIGFHFGEPYLNMNDYTNIFSEESEEKIKQLKAIF